MTKETVLTHERAKAVANIIQELAYAMAKWVATDDKYWREQADYLEGILAGELEGKSEE